MEKTIRDNEEDSDDSGGSHDPSFFRTCSPWLSWKKGCKVVVIATVLLCVSTK